MTPWTIVYQAPPSMAFSRQEYCSALPFPSPITKQKANIPLTLKSRLWERPLDHDWGDMQRPSKMLVSAMDVGEKDPGSRLGGGGEMDLHVGLMFTRQQCITLDSGLHKPRRPQMASPGSCWWGPGVGVLSCDSESQDGLWDRSN